jgi:hypothetical protein
MKRAARLRTKRKAHRRETKQPRQIAPLGLSVSEFCKAVGITRAFFYSQLGQMPASMRVGRRRIISTAAIQKWQQEREAAVI